MAAGLSCIFRHPMIRDDVNPRLAAIDPKTPFGAFQRTWRKTHCSVLNPFGDSSTCPFKPEDCVLAYWKTATDALLGAEKSKIGFFRVLARRRAYDRVENKPLERDEAVGRGRGVQEGQDLSGTRSGPVRIGTLLGSLDLRARQRPEQERKAGDR